MIDGKCPLDFVEVEVKFNSVGMIIIGVGFGRIICLCEELEEFEHLAECLLHMSSLSSV